MSDKQRTILKEVSLSDIGLHSGENVKMTFCPAKENYGIKFQRIDLDNQPIIEADADLVSEVQRGTTLTKNGCSVSTIEHALAALTGLGIDNCLIKINAQEVPIMDGSCKPFISILKSAGIKDLQAPKKYFEITTPIKFTDEEKGVELIALPADHYSITSMIDYDSPVLGKQFAELKKIEDFEEQISSSRTFCFLHELEYLAQNNLIKGGDLSNAIVVVDEVLEKERLIQIAKLLGKPSVEVNKEGILTQEINYDNSEANWCRFYYNTGELMEEGMYVDGEFKSTAQYNLKGKRINIAGGRSRKAEMDAKQNKLNYQALLKLNPKLAELKQEFDLEV